MSTQLEHHLREIFEEAAATSPTDDLAPVVRRRLRRRRVAAGAAAVVVAAGLVVALGLRTTDAPDHRDGGVAGRGQAPATGAVPDAGATKCVELYSLGGLSRQPIAFDGTVAALRPLPEPDLVEATFDVRVWYRGGAGDRVRVTMTSPSVRGGVEAVPTYAVGSRLLVSARPRFAGSAEVVATGCGFTRYRDPGTARDWGQVLD